MDMDLPEKIKRFIAEVSNYAMTEEGKWYEKLGDSYWLVKGATEEFTIDDVNYVLYPEAVCETQAFFEHMMLNKFEKKLVELGATYTHCTGIMD